MHELPLLSEAYRMHFKCRCPPAHPMAPAEEKTYSDPQPVCLIWATEWISREQTVILTQMQYRNW